MGWWTIPTIVTLACAYWIGVVIGNFRNPPQGTGSNVMPTIWSGIAPFVIVPLSTAISLAAWLIWALLR